MEHESTQNPPGWRWIFSGITALYLIGCAPIVIILVIIITQVVLAFAGVE